MPLAFIIGAGPAGSLTALLLARAGFEVELLEQHLFPRDKVCGECLSGLGVDVLGRAGVIADFHRQKPAVLTRSLLHSREGLSIDVPLPRASMGISRLKMDVLLLDAAKAAGVSVHQPARCEAIDFEGEKPQLRFRQLPTNAVQSRMADWIILADGKGTLMPRVTQPTGDLGIKTHFTNVNGPADAIELFAGQGHYGGLAAVEDNRWNAAFSVPARFVRRCSGDLQKVFDQIIAGNSALGQRMSGARRVGPWLASPLPRFAVGKDWAVDRHWTGGLPRVIPVGNAAAALEPVGGEGMGLALRSAELAAEAILRTESTGDAKHIRVLRQNFNKLWQIRRPICRGIAMIFSSEYLADAVAPLMAANLNVPAALMRLAGKAESVIDES
jgi:flavin-dependent dehydrogenase